MEWNEYLKLSERTLSDQFNSDSRTQRLLHAAIGVITEIEEILPNYSNGELITEIHEQGSLGEEIADVMWYVAILFREYGIDIKDDMIDISFSESRTDMNESPSEVLNELLFTSINLLDPLKKKLFYNKPILDEHVISTSIKIFELIVRFSDINGVDVKRSLQMNIDKLKARYGDKFSSDRAINRDLDTEKKIIEKF